ncbi:MULTISPECIES: type VI secretion system baseplate subunit TssE [unclassified Francisella]|uniref:type VI secretion system baseplate subunit TssE n=1 Tax=unclassified Francisella TaxID=2610885 RepID=UPI002E32E38A|nr:MULTISPECIES: type VI secretion system baseplate subunit TssE [unclassified Francisella]MED7818333.1 type VI secretion system baseplate subunit TssE [Francisella sp. 19S2-4]MED7829169.1 type VI secretion system baseplate subunit TssE [Francisella sp. 19S2-10]
MHRLRLLERLSAWESGKVSRFKEFSEYDLTESIIDHIGFILNTKQGNVKLSDNYGVPDFYNLESNKIESIIKDVISIYEPRFLVDRVIKGESDLTDSSKLKLSIMGKIRGSNNPLVITTVLTSNGRVTVSL